jgi:type VI protein secretion system component Hcp
MASDFFLKFNDFHKFESFEDNEGESFEGAAEQVAHDLRRLGENSVDLGGGFLKLINDVTLAPTENVSLDSGVVSLDIKLKHDDAIISHDFLKVGLDFVEISASQHKIDIKEIPIIKVIDVASPGLNLAADSVGGGDTPAVVTDLLKYEADLKITGLDFLKIAPGLGDAPAETLSLNFSKISFDYKEQGADELKLSEDFIALAKTAADLKIRGLSDAFLKYGEDALALGNDYLKLSADFHKISQDFAPPTTTDAVATGGELKFNQGVLQNSADFIKLAGDLKFLNTDLRAIGGDTLKLSDALETAAHQLLPAVQKG